MARNVPSNENQRPAAKATLHSMVSNQHRRPNKDLPRQQKSKRVHHHQTTFARDAKGTAVKKVRKREKKRNTGRKKNQ